MCVICLPLDSRPCNARFPAQLAGWCGSECVLPHLNEMDDFTRPAPFEASRAFIERELPHADAAVISVDKLCFGSLLASREEAVPQEEALCRLRWLADFCANYPHVPVYLVGVIIRASISALSSGDLDVYNAMTDYSYFTGMAQETGDADAAVKAKEAESRIPPEILRKYHAVRRRNHAVNELCIALTRQGAFRRFTLLMEDAKKYGFHRMEQARLHAFMGGDGRIFLRNGTDEGCALAVAEAVNPAGAQADVIWLGGTHGDFMARYEDRPFCENLHSALTEANIRVTPGAKAVIAIADPADGVQGEAGAAHCKGAIPGMADELNRLIADGRQVYLLDLISANGGCPDLVNRITNPRALAGYSGWNTASNAMGTLLAQVLSDAQAGRVNTAFRDERYLDDVIYESIVRQPFNNALRQMGEDPYHISDKQAAEALLTDMMAQATSPLLAGMPPWRVCLPWSRSFEAGFECDTGEM